jgi:hypothetical protein
MDSLILDWGEFYVWQNEPGYLAIRCALCPLDSYETFPAVQNGSKVDLRYLIDWALWHKDFVHGG